MAVSEAPRRGTAEAGGSGALLAVLAVALVAAAVVYLFLPPERADDVVLACLGVLATVGVMCLFAAVAGLLKPFRDPTAARGQAQWAADFLGALSDGALLTSRSGEPITANAAYLRLTGAESPEDLKPIERLFSNDPDAAEAVYRLSSAATQGRRASEEIRLPSGIDGRSEGARWYRVRANPVSEEGGAIGWLIADITRERARQENIYQELQNAIDYLDHAPAGFFSVEADGRLRYLNATLAEWRGIDLAEFEPGKRNIGEFMSPETLSLLSAEPPGRDGEVVAPIDLDLIRANGTRLPVRLLHRVSVAADGAVGASRTLVLRTRADGEGAAANLAAARFSRFFNHTPLAIAAVDRAGRLGLTNARFMMLFARPGEKRPERLVDVVVPADRPALAATIEAAVMGQSEIPAVEASFAADPSRSGRFYVSPVIDGHGDSDAAIVYALETTEQRALAAKLAQSQKMNAVGQLAGGIAHDFNNVLQGIIGFADLLLRSHPPSDPSFGDIMQIKQNASRAAGLVRQLLAFSRQQTLRPKVLDLPDVLSDVSVLLARLLGERVSLTFHDEPGLWPVKADANQLEQVIVNLAVNAKDAMPDGGSLAIRTANVPAQAAREWESAGLPAGDWVMISVTDTGTGMTPEVQAKIFDPFFSTKEVGKGTGLGLSTVYGIVAQTGGHILVESKPGLGTTFRIFLPRHFAGAGVEREEAPAPPAHAPTDLTGAATILLVEDEDTVRLPVARTLKDQGYTVHEAASGLEALDKLAAIDGRVDLVITDVVMPEMDGPTLVDRIRETHPTVRVIFMSGYAEDVFANRVQLAVGTSFLSKPFSLKDMGVAVKRVLGT